VQALLDFALRAAGMDGMDFMDSMDVHEVHRVHGVHFQALEISARKIPSLGKFSAKSSNAWKKSSSRFQSLEELATKEHKRASAIFAFLGGYSANLLAIEIRSR
jgi:hypothetical protein